MRFSPACAGMTNRDLFRDALKRITARRKPALASARAGFFVAAGLISSLQGGGGHAAKALAV
jgi:hypothetical protein